MRRCRCDAGVLRSAKTSWPLVYLMRYRNELRERDATGEITFAEYERAVERLRESGSACADARRRPIRFQAEAREQIV